LFDRHFYFDYLAHDVAGGAHLPLSRRLHGFVLRRLYPQPDLVIVLDAPAEVLFARKPEGSLEAVSARRLEYLDAARANGSFATVDATRPLAQVKADVARIVERFAVTGAVDAVPTLSRS
jgi:thymidylate kinase